MARITVRLLAAFSLFALSVPLSPPGGPASGGSDHASFQCSGAPAVSLGALSWDYSNTTWHTNRDSYDKIIIDDLKNNATLTAMLVYLASEDKERSSRKLLCVQPQRSSANYGR